MYDARLRGIVSLADLVRGVLFAVAILLALSFALLIGAVCAPFVSWQDHRRRRRIRAVIRGRLLDMDSRSYLTVPSIPRRV